MEREHLIIIALILVALYMMNSSSSSDKVTAMGPLGRIRYTEDGVLLSNMSGPNYTHIRTRREGFYGADAQQDSAGQNQSSVGPDSHIRLSDKYFGGSQHIKNHIRSRNTNSSFNGLMTGEPFRFTCGPNDMPC